MLPDAEAWCVIRGGSCIPACSCKCFARVQLIRDRVWCMHGVYVLNLVEGQVTSNYTNSDLPDSMGLAWYSVVSRNVHMRYSAASGTCSGMAHCKLLVLLSFARENLVHTLPGPAIKLSSG